MTLVALGALGVACVACSDGVGVPIRLGALDQDDASDEATDEDGGFDERDRNELDEAHCEATFDWPETYAADEAALLDAINAVRERSIRCDEGDEIDDLAPLRVSEALRCSARLHSLDMVQRDFVGRTNPDGDRPGERMRAAGFDVEDWDESLAIGEREPQDALRQLLLDDGDDCRNVATRRHTHIGIGRYEDRWTLDFAAD
jgi:uncharacterized protein YkwD